MEAQQGKGTQDMADDGTLDLTLRRPPAGWRKTKPVRLDGETYKVVYDDDGVGILAVAQQKTTTSGDIYWSYLRRNSQTAAIVLGAI
jgi:hypothetical protein